MLGHGAKFDQKMEQAIAALLTHGSVEAAARAVGINPNTLLRWMKEPEFEAALREARRAVISQAIGRLQSASDAAAMTLLKIMLDPTMPPGTRLRAIEIVLERGTKATEMEDLLDRVAKLERLADSLNKSRERPARITWLNAAPLPGPAPRAEIAPPRPDEAKADEDVAD